MAVDGSLIFNTGIDSSGFTKGLSGLTTAAGAAAAAITAVFTGAAAAAVSVGTSYTSAMSQVAATMGITTAAEDYAVLSAAAKEMGATTKYSASQAADALNFLALAGYNAQQAVSALPTVLNLAAAGGIDLAYASDMVTDSMSALGLGMDELEGFADKLAKTSQKSNTNVAQLGEAILTVGGTAKSLAGGVEELNTMLGVIADNGVKGAEGGTALRNVILSLSAPTSTAAAELERLGIEAYDLNGNLRYLPDIFADFNTALSSLTEGKKTQALNNIFNKVDLKTVNALLGTSAERFDELAGYIADCDGAAAQMADTMSDNLEGDMLAMQSALEAVGVSAFEKFENPLRSAVQAVTESLAEFNSEISDGELSEKLEKISEVMGSLISRLGEFAADKALPAIIDGMSQIIEHGEQIMLTLEIMAGGFIAFKTAAVLTNVILSFQSASYALVDLAVKSGTAAIGTAALKGELSLSAVALALYNKQITVSTALTSAFGAAFMSITLPIAAVAAAIAGLVIICKNVKDAKEQAIRTAVSAADSYRAEANAIHENAEAYREVREEADSMISEREEEIAKISVLKNRLDELTDDYGNVTGSQEEARAVVEELNELYPGEIELINGKISGYENLSAAVDDYIEKLREETRFEANKKKYSEALLQYDEASAKDEELQKQQEEAEAAYLKAKKDWDYYKSGLNNYTMTQKRQAEELGMNIGTYLESQYKSAEAIFYATSEAWVENHQVMNQALEDMSVFEKSFSESITGENINSQRTAAEAYANAQTERWRTAAEKASEEQEKISAKLEKGWKDFDHQYAIGAIASEQELYAKKKALLDEYGDSSLEEHWKYYEELYGYEQGFAADEKRLEEERLEESRKNREENLKLQKEAQEKALDNMRDVQKKALSSVQKNLGSIISEYTKAYSDYESNVKSYKAKLLSVGDIFTFTSETDKNGKTTNTYTVQNIKKQMEEMRKYHEYVKQLKAQGASKGLIEELTSMDFEQGAQFGKFLAGMSSSDFADINELYKQRDELAEELARDMFADDAKQINTALTNSIYGVLDDLPKQARAAGKQLLEGLLSGIDISSDDLSEYASAFSEGFSEMYENAIENMDLRSSFEYAFAGLDTYSMGTDMARQFNSGFNAELARLTADVNAGQVNFGVTTASAGNTAVNSPKGEEKISLEVTINSTTELDGNAVGESVTKYQNENVRRRGN